MYTNTSRESALKVLNPPQNPVMRRSLYIEFKSLFRIKKVNTAAAKKQPKKLEASVPIGKQP